MKTINIHGEKHDTIEIATKMIINCEWARYSIERQVSICIRAFIEKEWRSFVSKRRRRSRKENRSLGRSNKKKWKMLLQNRMFHRKTYEANKQKNNNSCVTSTSEIYCGSCKCLSIKHCDLRFKTVIKMLLLCMNIFNNPKCLTNVFDLICAPSLSSHFYICFPQKKTHSHRKRNKRCHRQRRQRTENNKKKRAENPPKKYVFSYFTLFYRVRRLINTVEIN